MNQERSKATDASNEENNNALQQDNKNAQNGIETVVSDNENMEPVPDKEEQERRADSQQ